MKRYYLDQLGLDYIGNKKAGNWRYKLHSFFRFKQNHKYRKLKRKYGFDVRETWNTDTELFYWLYERVSYLLEDHGCADFEDAGFFSFENMNLLQSMELLRDLLKEYLLFEDTDDYPTSPYIFEGEEMKENPEFDREDFMKYYRERHEKQTQLYDRIFEVLKAILPHMWW